MSRISIDVSPQQHKRLKALAALRGKSIKDYVLERTLAPIDDEDKALLELESLLDQRLSEAASSEPSPETVESIFQDAYRKKA